MTATTGESEHPLRSYDLAIDGPALRAQRQRLLELADALHWGKQVRLRPADTELIDGLINLTDEVADQAAERHSIDCLIHVTSPMKNPANLAQDELVEIVTGVVRILYGVQQPDGTWTYAANKPWCGGDVCEANATLLDRFDLVPQVNGDGQPMERPNV